MKRILIVILGCLTAPITQAQTAAPSLGAGSGAETITASSGLTWTFPDENFETDSFVNESVTGNTWLYITIAGDVEIEVEELDWRGEVDGAFLDDFAGSTVADYLDNAMLSVDDASALSAPDYLTSLKADYPVLGYSINIHNIMMVRVFYMRSSHYTLSIKMTYHKYDRNKPVISQKEVDAFLHSVHFVK